MEVFIMKKSIITLMVLFTFLIFASGTAFSADQAKDKPGAAGQDRQPGATMGQQHGAMMGQQGGLSFNQPQRLSEIIGSDVVNHQGEDLGSVDDLVANEQGQLEYLILSRGGVLGVGANLIAIPLDAVSPQITEDNELRINVDEATLDQAPTFAAGDYPDFADRQWQQESRGYFQNGAATSPGMRDRERSPGMQQQDRSPGMQQEQTPRGGAQDGTMTPREGTRESGTTPRGSDAR
jgi:sporulation protein YlmC with PRC-barrel domain